MSDYYYYQLHVPMLDTPPLPHAWCPEAEISSGDLAGRARHGLGQLGAEGWGGNTDRIQGVRIQ